VVNALTGWRARWRPAISKGERLFQTPLGLRDGPWFRCCLCIFEPRWSAARRPTRLSHARKLRPYP
jgi:hypothetical protein